MALLEATGLAKDYNGKSILKEVTVAIERGETFTIIGPTGTGKTTLLRLLDLIEAPTSGNIHFDGNDVTGNRHAQLEARRRMSYVQQKPVIFTMSVYENIACGLKWRHQKSKIIRQKIDSTLELVDMNDYRERNAKTLSGGETQLIAIARAIVTEPEILFLDEPTANLDPISTSKIEGVVANIIQERKTAVVMATHNMPQGQRMANRIGVLLNGCIRQIGTPSDIFGSPNSREVAEFVGIDNILPGTIVARDDNLLTIDIAGHSVQAVSDHLTENKVYVLVRPEDITFSLSKELTSARNTFGGKITKLTPVGALTRIEVDCGFPLMGVITGDSARKLALKIGQQIVASFKATATHVIHRY